MSETAAAPAAPAAAPTNAAPADPKAPKQVKPTNGLGSTKAPEAPSWSDADNETLLNTLKRSPFGKRKVNGKEETVSSVDDLKRWILDSQRGVGANRVVEESKREAEEGRKAKAEAERLKQAVARLKKGDREALRELGLDEGAEAEEQRAIEALPPEVREVLEHNRMLQRKLQEREEAEKRQLQEREEAGKKQQREATLARAKELAPQILKDIKPEMYDVELPSVLMAMEDLKAQGMRLGVDYTPEQLSLYIDQIREQEFGSRVTRMKPDAAAKLLGPQLKSLKAEQLPEVLGDLFVPLGRLFAEAWTGHWKRKRAAPPQQNQAQRPADEPVQKPKPLSPFRYQR